MSRSFLTAALLGLASMAVVARPDPASAQTAAEMKLTVTVAGRTETLRGRGLCGHEPRAWIYGRAARLWTASYGEATASSVSLTYWRPAAAGEADQFSLSVQNGRKLHRIATVRGGQLVGSGSSSFRPTAVGGRFEITGTTADGAALHATIECARFGTIAAEGG